MSQKLEGYVKSAELTPDKKGIIIKLLNEKKEVISIKSTIEDDWLKIPEGKNAEEELKKTCCLLTGYRYVNGQKIPIPNFKMKKITIIKE